MKIAFGLGIIAIFLSYGCATRSDLLGDGVRGIFQSTRQPKLLAVCIDRNADGYAYGALESKIIDTGTEPLEVVIRNGPGQWAVVQIAAVPGGSIATFYLGGAALINSEQKIDRITEGCR